MTRIAVADLSPQTGGGSDLRPGQCRRRAYGLGQSGTVPGSHWRTLFRWQGGAVIETEWVVTSPDGDRTHIRLRRYSSRVVDFAIQQIHVSASGIEHPVARIDCCNGTVHRHQFVKSTGKDIYDHRVIRQIPHDKGWQVVLDEYNLAHDIMMAEWNENLHQVAGWMSENNASPPVVRWES